MNMNYQTVIVFNDPKKTTDFENHPFSVERFNSKRDLNSWLTAQGARCHPKDFMQGRLIHQLEDGRLMMFFKGLPGKLEIIAKVKAV